MKYINFYFFLLIQISVLAQKVPVNGIGYKILRDNTDTKFVAGNLAFGNVTISGARMSLAAGPGIRFYANGLYASVDYEFHYLDGLATALKENPTTAFSVYKNQKSRNAEANIGYFFRKKVEKKVSLFLYSETKMSKTINYYINVDAHVNKIFGFQLGYKSGFANILFPSGVNVKSYDNVNEDVKPSSFNMSTVMQYNWISFGPSYGITEDVIADIEGYGIRNAQYFSRFYTNILYAPKTKLEDVYYAVEPTSSAGTNKTLFYRYVLDGNVQMSNLGFNVGYQTFKFNKFGVSNNIEAGIMPGVKSDLMGNFYLSLKFGFSLGKCFPK